LYNFQQDETAIAVTELKLKQRLIENLVRSPAVRHWSS